jgi:Right handed beta helix region
MAIVTWARHAGWLGAVGAAVLVMTGGAAAKDGGVQCGDVITVDTTLTEDLTGCGELGLRVEAGVTLDLNGHTIRGTGGGVGLNVEGRATSGTVRGFGTGITAIGISSTVVAGTALPGDVAIVSEGERTVIIRNGSDGLATGAMVVDVGSALIDRMTIRANGSGILTFGTVRLERNEISNNSSHGIEESGPESLADVVVDNVITANGGDGVTAERATAIYEGNLIARNAGTGIRLHESVSAVRNNTIRSNGGDGLSIIDGCLASGPAWIGLYRIGGNDVDRNGALGINLQPTATCLPEFLPALIAMADEGGNTARNNGDPRECVYIVCTKN